MFLQELFYIMVNMSLTGSFVILAVLLVRIVLKRTAKIFSYLLWFTVLIRLLCPIAISSDFSLFNVIPQTNHQIETQGAVSSISYLPALSQQENNSIQSADSHLTLDSIEINENHSNSFSFIKPISVLPLLWLCGVLAMVFSALVSTVRLKRKLIASIHVHDNIYLSDYIDTAFVLGWIRPRIYLPSALNDQQTTHILLHERHHLQRKDHWWKAMFYLALSLHWFNPLVWLSFHCFTKDMEMSCDEAVVQKYQGEFRKEYALSLLSMQDKHSSIAALAFNEHSTAARIKNLSIWKKPVLLFSIFLSLILMLLCGLLLTNPKNKQTLLMGNHYDIDEILYAVTVGDEISYQAPNAYCISADYQLYEHSLTEGWIHLGKLTPYPLSLSELNQMIPVEIMRNQFTIDAITDAYILHTGNQNFYLAFQTKSGNTYLSYGWEDVSERFQDASDDTCLRRLYLLKSRYHADIFSGLFYEQSLAYQIQQHLQVFSVASFPQGSVVGFLSGDAEDSMTDMGYAVFLKGMEHGYKLQEWYVYPHAAVENNGLLFCPDPAVLNDTGNLVLTETYDVILSCNPELTEIKKVVRHQHVASEMTTRYPIQGPLSITLIGWDKDDAASSTAIYYLDKHNKLLNPSSEQSIESILSQAIEQNYLKSCPAGRMSVYSYLILNSEDITEFTPHTIIYAEILQQIFSPFLDENKQMELLDEVSSQVYFAISQTSEGPVVHDFSYQELSESYIDYTKIFNAADEAQTKRLDQLRLECQRKAAAVIQSKQQNYLKIETILNEIMSSNSASSSPIELLENHPDEIQRLLNYNDQLLDYCFTEFIKGNQTDLKGHLMKYLCQTIIQNWHDEDVEQDFSTGQEWFEAYKSFTLKTRDQYINNHIGYFKRWYPAAWHLTELIDEFNENNS